MSSHPARHTDLRDAGARLDQWIEREGLRGWDPYDAMRSPLFKTLAFGNRHMGQVWVQLFKRSPVNARALFGIDKGFNPKAMGLFLATYWRKYLMGGSPADAERVNILTTWLKANAATGCHGACWGYNFDWPNRGFLAPAGTPTIVNTAFIGLAFLDLHRLKNGQASLPVETVGVPTARSACDFVLEDLWADRRRSDELAFAYTPLDRRVVHNASVLGARLLAEVSETTGESSLGDCARRAALFTARRQRPDGSWAYGESKSDGWADNFHTGYVLTALKTIGTALRTAEFDEQVTKGYRAWKTGFFEPDMTPKYYLDSKYPVDVHSAAQAILTFIEFRDLDPEAVELAERVARWAIDHMQRPDGAFSYQIHRFYRIDIPYMRWSQAWMQRALVELEWVRVGGVPGTRPVIHRGAGASGER